ncbi:MAG: phosphate regulon sensor histidine kinase PhoR [Mariprofundaceae bacterium]|nr:phosphate regulon sensor histidine kinase PhoR [Mariprofundaceae bacterium]
MLSPWSTEGWRMAGLAFTALVVGVLSGHVLLVLFLAALAYLGWHLFNLFRLESWLKKGGASRPPENAAIWGDVYYHFHRSRARHRKRSRKLAEVINQFRESTAAMPDATVVMGACGEINWFNEAAEQLLGLRSPQDIGGRLVNLVRHPGISDYIERQFYSEALEIPSPVDKRITLAVNIVPYGKDQRLFIARDITRMKRLEQTRRDFVANVSHELRTPLTVINGFLETMSDTDDDEKIMEWKRSVTLMLQHTSRMQHIIDDLLLLSRLESDKHTQAREPVSIPAMLAAIREDAVTLSGDQRHDIQLESDPGLSLIGNGKELHSAFSNLVANAVRYTPAEGKIHILWHADETGAHFQVSDTGIGIAPQHIARITERFYRVDAGRSREGGGTGLGLAIVKHVLERHNAKLRIHSEPGKGSQFTCDFPPEEVIYHIEKR